MPAFEFRDLVEQMRTLPMSVELLRDFVALVRALVRTSAPDLHPAGRATIDHWLGDMRHAADHGDAAAVARLARLIEAKVELELEWQREDEAPWEAPHVE